MIYRSNETPSQQTWLYIKSKNQCEITQSPLQYLWCRRIFFLWPFPFIHIPGSKLLVFTWDIQVSNTKELQSLMMVNTILLVFPYTEPANVISRLASSTSDSLTFMWDPLLCEHIHGVFSRYRYKLMRDGQLVKSGNLKDASDKEKMIQSLTPCKNYSFLIQAKTKTGNLSQSSNWTSVEAETGVVGRHVYCLKIHKESHYAQNMHSLLSLNARWLMKSMPFNTTQTIVKFDR